MIFFIVKGGPVMYPILVASVLGLALILERFWVLRRAGGLDMEGFSEAVARSVSEGKFEAAETLCRQHAPYALASMFLIVLENRRMPRPDLEKMLERVAKQHIKNLERRLGGLVSIVGIAPLLGFLGTITGLIRAFMAWEKAGSDITVSALASGIYEAMITTAAGLIVAIPYYLCYNYFVSRIKYFAHELEDYAGGLLDILAGARSLIQSK